MTEHNTMRHRFQRFLRRRYTAWRCYFGSRPPNVFTHLFFGLREKLERLTTGRKMSDAELAERKIWKAIYFMRYGTQPLFKVETDRPVASESSDNKWPKGTVFVDLSRNRDFNLKVYSLFNHRPDLRFMDVGCSGGGLVKSFLEDGYTAVGLEGSDWSFKLRAGEWDTCPHHLLLCDITSRFQVRTSKDEAMQFHCVTAWEVLEHIPEEKLAMLIDNISRHLTPDGIFVASVNIMPDNNPITGAVYHVTLKPREWWLEQFRRAGLVEVERNPFETTDYARGHGMKLNDWDPADGDGFHLVLRKEK